jgi:hypothetical protein
MQKITYLIGGFLLLSMDVALISFSIEENEKIPNIPAVFTNSERHSLVKNQDKNLLKGTWRRDDETVEIRISNLLENGGLALNYLNSEYIFIEKAGWTDSSDVLRLLITYRQDDHPGYNLSLNYLAEKDLLVGVYVDGSNNKLHNVTFKRIE